MLRAEVALRHVAQVLGEARQRAGANGTVWTAALESAWLLATGRQKPTELVSGTGSADDAPMVLALEYDEVARRLRVSKRTVERLAATGDLPVVSIGGNPRVRVGDLLTFVDELPVRSARA